MVDKGLCDCFANALFMKLVNVTTVNKPLLSVVS